MGNPEKGDWQENRALLIKNTKHEIIEQKDWLIRNKKTMQNCQRFGIETRIRYLARRLRKLVDGPCGTF
jgi:hypothetical protein